MAFMKALRSMNTVQYLQDVFSRPDSTPSQMQDAIKMWYGLYYNDLVIEGCKRIPSTNLPHVIVDNVVSAVFQEYEARPNAKESEGASTDETKEFIDILDNLLPRLLQGVSIGGEGFLKPGLDDGKVYVTFIDRLNYIVLGRDYHGVPNDVVFSSNQTVGKFHYTLFERREQHGDDVIITNKLYRSEDRGSIGVEADSLDEWYEDLEPEVILKQTPDIGMVYVKMPMHNTVGPYPDGVSLYASAVDKILQVYEHEYRQEREYRLTEPHMVVSQDVIPNDETGKPTGDIPEYIYALDEAPADVGIVTYNPEPHQTQLEDRENQLLRHVENQVGLRRGIISRVDSENKTATEVLSTTTRYANMLNSIQDVLAGAVLRLVETVNLLLTAIGAGFRIHEVDIVWGNGVLYDEDKDFQRLFDLTNADYVRPEYVVGWQFNATTNTQDDLDKIREKYMPEDSSTGRTFGILDVPVAGEEETDVDVPATGKPTDDNTREVE